MSWLTSLPALGTLVVMFAIAAAVAAGSQALVRRVVPAGEQDQILGIAAPLMPALGAAFAVLVALTLSSEAGYLRSAQENVALEAAAAARLAWAATTEGVEPQPIHSALTDYLRAVRTEEWRGEGAAHGNGPATEAALGRLERAVRTAAATPNLSSATSAELFGSLDSLSSARRVRIAAAARDLPVLYLLTLVVSGLALVSNAAVLTFRSSGRTALLIGGLATVVAMSLALLLALSAPWRGALIVSGGPIDEVARDLTTGFFVT